MLSLQLGREMSYESQCSRPPGLMMTIMYNPLVENRETTILETSALSREPL